MQYPTHDVRRFRLRPSERRQNSLMLIVICAGSSLPCVSAVFFLPVMKRGTADQTGHTSSAVLVAEFLEAPTTCCLIGARHQQVLIQTFTEHLTFGLEAIRVDLDANPQAGHIQHLLQQRKNDRVCGSRTQASKSAPSQWRVERVDRSHMHTASPLPRRDNGPSNDRHEDAVGKKDDSQAGRCDGGFSWSGTSAL